MVRRKFVYVKTGTFRMYFFVAVEHTEKDENHNRFYVFFIYVPAQEVYGQYT